MVESTSSIFERAALAAVLKFKYKPRVVDGDPIEESRTLGIDPDRQSEEFELGVVLTPLVVEEQLVAHPATAAVAHGDPQRTLWHRTLGEQAASLGGRRFGQFEGEQDKLLSA